MQLDVFQIVDVSVSVDERDAASRGVVCARAATETSKGMTKYEPIELAKQIA